MQTLDHLLARMPISLKGSMTYRIGGKLIAMQTADKSKEGITSNLGISNRYKMVVPADKTQFVFGTPMTYRGERGVLYLSKYLAPAVDIIMDVGANWGYYSYFLRSHIDEDIPIYFFEPNDKLFNAIEQNIHQNDLKNIHGFKKGVSSYTGTASFFVNLTNDLSSTLDKNFVQEGEKVVEHSIEVISFDDFVSQHVPGKKWLVKVDIENAEPEFIKGAAKKMDQIEFLIIEFLEKARKAKLADQLTTQFGFHAYYINDFTLEYMPKEDGRYTPPEYNFLFCREQPEQLAKRLADSPFKVQP